MAGTKIFDRNELRETRTHFGSWSRSSAHHDGEGWLEWLSGGGKV